MSLINSVQFVGLGNMGGALATAICESKIFDKSFFYTPSHTKAKLLSEAYSGVYQQTLEVMPVKFLIIGCKPYQLMNLAKTLRGKIAADTIVVSMLAGTSVEALRLALNHQRIIRIMPNTPCLVNQGITLLYSPENNLDKLLLEKALSKCGVVFNCSSEDMLDQLTAFTGSGPGVIFDLMNYFLSSLEKTKLVSHEEGLNLIRELFLGTAKLSQKEEKLDFSKLRDQVTSQKGITHEIIRSLDSENLGPEFDRAFSMGVKRAEEIKEETLEEVQNEFKH